MAQSPLVVFAYKRKDKLESCLLHLEKNILCKDTDLFIFADGPKDEKDKEQVLITQNFIKEYCLKSSFSKVTAFYSDTNKGLANSIISGVTQVISEYGKVIVVEDDLLVSTDFLEYMNCALDYYADNKNIGSISAYSYPLRKLKRYKKDIYTLRKGECWGWATWSDRWIDVDWNVSDFEYYYNNGKLRHQFNSLEIGLDRMLCDQMAGRIDSWAVRWVYHLFKKNYLTVYPRRSKTSNIGFDNTGTHCNKNNKFTLSLSDECTPTHFEDIKPDKELERECRFYSAGIVDKIRYFVKI